MSMLATVVDTQALLDTVIASLVSGLGVTFVFAIGLLGAARFGQMSREGRGAAAITYGLVTAVAGVAFTAAIVVGIVVMTSK